MNRTADRCYLNCGKINIVERSRRIASEATKSVVRQVRGTRHSRHQPVIENRPLPIVPWTGCRGRSPTLAIRGRAVIPFFA